MARLQSCENGTDIVVVAYEGCCEMIFCWGCVRFWFCEGVVDIGEVLHEDCFVLRLVYESRFL